MSKFKVDDVAFVPKYKHEQRRVPCPVCYGKLEVVLILGNEDRVTLPCGYCGHGYEGPRGYTIEWGQVVAADRITITGITTETTGAGDKIEYQFGCYVFSEDRLFANEEDALEKAKIIKAQQDEEQRTKAKYLKHDAHKKFAWNAGYHLREAKGMRRRAEYHDKQAVLCKAKAKEPENA